MVVGLPLSLSGGDSAQTVEVREFAERLARAIPVPVELYDERFTTSLAARVGGSTSLDSRAAATLLDEWLHLPMKEETPPQLPLLAAEDRYTNENRRARSLGCPTVADPVRPPGIRPARQGGSRFPVFGKRSDQHRTAEDRARAAADRAARRAGRPLPAEAFEHTVRPPDIEPREPLVPEEPLPTPSSRRLPSRVEEVAPPAEVADEPEPEPEPRARAGARTSRGTDEPIHQPTVEYSPFGTDEIDRVEPEAPLGSPRDDEPRLVAARGSPRDEDEIHAFAAARTARPPSTRLPPRRGSIATDETRSPARAAAHARPTGPPTPRRAGAPHPTPASPADGRPKGPRTGGGAHWGRRIFAVIALVVFLGALYVANRPSSRSTATGRAPSRSHPANTDAGEIGEDPRGRRGSWTPRASSSSSATINGDRGKLRPGQYTLKKGMTNGAVIDALIEVPEAQDGAARRSIVTLVEGPSRKENAPVVDEARRSRASYAKASGSKATLAGSASSARPRAPRPPRASCSRPRTSCRRARPPTIWSSSSSTRSRRTSRAST